MHEMGLAQPGTSVNKEGVVGLSRRFRNGQRSCLRKAVIGPDNEGIEGIAGVEV